MCHKVMSTLQVVEDASYGFLCTLCVFFYPEPKVRGLKVRGSMVRGSKVRG